MPKNHDRPLFTYIASPTFQLREPDAVLTAVDLDLLQITVEDFRYITREVTDDLTEVTADIRSRSTILRRLLSHGDLFNIGRIYRPPAELRVNARMLIFDPLHSGCMVTCGGYPWGNDRLDGMTIEHKVDGVPPLNGTPWSYQDGEVALSQYLEGLAIGIFGTPIRRKEVIKYVADKKAAHVSDKRRHKFEWALDCAWSGLSYTIKASTGDYVRLNAAYLELLPVIEAIAESRSINSYIDAIDEWLKTAQPVFPSDVQPVGMSIRVKPKRRR